jgi:hypothetical protein
MRKFGGPYTSSILNENSLHSGNLFTGKLGSINTAEHAESCNLTLHYIYMLNLMGFAIRQGMRIRIRP